MKKKLLVSTEELVGHIAWLDAIHATILNIEDDRGGSGSWVIHFTSKGE